jgi:hypothetical protein
MYTRHFSGLEDHYRGLEDPPPGPAVAPAPARKPLRRIRCTAAELEKVNQILGKTHSADEIQSLIQRAVDGGILLGRGAAVPVVGQRAKLFESVFGVAPSWHPAGAGWVLGGVVKKRFEMAAKLLSSGTLWFSCFGLPWRDVFRGVDDPNDYILNAAGGIYRVGLGKRFWDAVRDGDTETAESAMLGAGLRVAFGKLIQFGSPRHTKNNGYCYMRYALHLAGRTIPVWLGNKCPIPPDRWNRLMPSPTSTPPASTTTTPPPARPIRLRLTDEELEQILGRKLGDPLSEHINWIIQQVPPTAKAQPTLGDQLKRKLGEKVDQVSDRLGVPQRLRKYVRQVAEGAAKKGAKLVVEEGLKKMGIESSEAIEAVWGTVERVTQESP